MEEGKASVTAKVIAMFRAAHLLWDDRPKIFEDTLALQLSGCENEAALRVQLDGIESEIAQNTDPHLALTLRRSLTGTVLVRSRYLEDEVEQAVARGVSQYVILGAGLDSFAYRRSDLAKALKVFEVDHRATQGWKTSRLQEAGVELPPNLSLVPVDFEKNSLIDSLRTNGYQTGAPGIFSWLGVTMYLTSDAIFGTLQAIAALKPGTEIIFEYNVPRELLDESGQRLHAALTAFVAARGEPQQSFFEPADLAEQVRKLGFAEISDVGPGEVESRYFAGRSDDLRPLAFVHLMRARVGLR